MPDFPLESTEDTPAKVISHLESYLDLKAEYSFVTVSCWNVHGNGFCWRKAACSEVMDKHPVQASLDLPLYYAR